MTLYPKSGKSDKLMEIELDNKTIVYVCDTSNRNNLEITTIGGIEKTFLPKQAYDDEDNVTFTSEYDYCYALARLVDGKATDIIVYKN